MENLNEAKVDEKLDLFFSKLKCAARLSLVFGFTLKIIEDGIFRHSCAHGIITLMDRWKLVCTKDDLMKLKKTVNKTDVTESSSREEMNTTCRFYKLTKLTVNAAVFKDVPVARSDAVLSKPLLKNRTINCPI